MHSRQKTMLTSTTFEVSFRDRQCPCINSSIIVRPGPKTYRPCTKIEIDGPFPIYKRLFEFTVIHCVKYWPRYLS